MASTIVVGGQYGSEGKGKVVALCAGLRREPLVARCGGPNSGHTVWIGNERVVLRQVPAAAGNPNALLLLSAGCAVDEDVLAGEIHRLCLPRERLVVDPRAVLITQADKEAEREIAQSIASTGSGTGAALRRRMSRTSAACTAGRSERLRALVRVEPVAPLLHAHLDKGGDVIVEGTQGFGLSLFHGPDYPHVTSRDTTAAGFASEVGLSPRHVDNIILVIRTFPIRVGGPSGDLPDEITWEDVRTASGAPEVIPEFTSVTGKLRRVARFDLEAVETACRYNGPSSLAIMGLDRLDFANYRAREKCQLTAKAMTFVRTLEDATGVRAEWLGTGFETREALHVPGDIDNSSIRSHTGTAAFASEAYERDWQAGR